MYRTLGPEAIGVRGLTLPAAIELARASGFEGLAFDIRAAAALAEERGLEQVRGLFEAAGVRPAFWSLPVNWRQEEEWREDLAALPKLAAVGRDLGAARTATFMPSGSDTRPFAENFAWHVDRLGAIGRVLREADCRLGIEYIGTESFRAAFKHPFIHTLDGTLDLIEAIGLDNVGLMVDSWHMYAAGETVAEIDRLSNEQVVVAHVNDAPAGITREDQTDTVRALPLETGVIDLGGFMEKLVAMGYDGPVMPEPFSQRLVERAANDPMGAAAEAGAAMAALWRVAGLEDRAVAPNRL